MTSNQSYSKLISSSLKNHMWGIAISCIGLFFALPVFAALNVTIVNNQFLNGIYKADVLAKVFSRNVYGEGNFILGFVTVILSVIISLNGFSYLFYRDKVDFYHSLPVKRKDLFVSNYLAGIITYVVPYVLFMVITLAIGGAYGLLSANGITSALISCLINLLGFVGLYSVSVLAVMLTGNMIVSILAIGVMFCYGTIVEVLLDEYKNIFFLTYSWMSNIDIENTVSPVFAYSGLNDGMNTYAGRYEMNYTRIILFLVVTVLIIIANLMLYKIRPSEAAGKSIAFKKTMPVIAVLLLIPASLIGALTFESVADTGIDISYGWLFFGAAFALVIGHLIIQAIYYRDFKSLFKNLINPLISGAIVVLVLLTFIFDLVGYDNYNPAGKSNFESMAVSSYGVQDYQEYYNFDVEANEYGDRNYWIDSNTYKLEHVKITDKQFIDEFVKTAVENNRAYELACRSTDDNQELNKGCAYTEFNVRYNLSNGRSVYRKYTIDLMANKDLYNRLYTNKEYKEGVFDILTLDNEDIHDLRFDNVTGNVGSGFTKEQKNEILDSYRKELLAQDAGDIMTSAPVGYIYDYVVMKEHGYTSTYYVHKSYIYPSFTQTIGKLAEAGVDIHKYLTLENVESIRVSNYNSDDSDDSVLYEEYYGDYKLSSGYYGSADNNTAEYTDIHDIEAIWNVITPSEMADVNSLFNKNAYLDILVTFKEVPDGNGYYSKERGFYIPQGMVPDFVIKDVNYTGE